MVLLLACNSPPPTLPDALNCVAPQVTAVAYDNPIPGFKTNNTINLRLWAAKPDTEFDLEAFNTGDYIQASLHLARQASCILPPTGVRDLHQRLATVRLQGQTQARLALPGEKC